MTRKPLLWIFAVTFALSLLPGLRAQDANAPVSGKPEPLLESLAEAISTIQDNYVEPVDTKELLQGALRGMMTALDPDCQYVPPSAVERMRPEATGTFAGLGIELTKREGFVTVVTALAGTPAYRAGLLAGDRILKIADEILRDPDLNDVVSRLRGKEGTQVTLTILRGKDTIKTFTMTRSVIKLANIAEARILEDSIGYIKLAQFQERAAADLDTALTGLENQGMDALVLDLRENPGGWIDSAVQVADLFIPGDRVIVSVKGRRPHQDRKYTSHDPGTHPLYPLAVLINGSSASGAEIVAAAIKELRRGVLVGENTYGRGSLQSLVPLKSGAGAIKLTTARYFTPSGARIPADGIAPDVLVRETPEQAMKRRSQQFAEMEKALQQAKEPAVEEVGEKAPKLPEEIEQLTEETQEEVADVQLQEAVRILKGLKAVGAPKVSVPSGKDALE
jgi:carboxyl-terminal processing protease